jgi:predicted dehydrogenase
VPELGVGFIGCGRILDLNILGYLDRDDAEVVAFCDVREDLLERRVGEYGEARAYRDYHDLLADDDVDIVEILTPHHLHKQMVIDALEAGKHVSLQKPPALDLVEMDQMIEASEKAGAKLKIYENFIFYPPYLRAKELLMAGEIGPPVGLRMKMCGSMSPSGWEVPLEAWAWRITPETCGGGPCLFDDGYHKWSVAIDLLGEVDKVFSWIGNKEVIPGVCIDAPGVVAWRYKGKRDMYGVCDHLICDELYIESKYYAIDERLEITGEKGVLWVLKWTADMLQVPPVILYRDGELVQYDDMPQDWSDSFIASTHHFIDAINNDTEPRLTPRQGREVLRFSMAMLRSAAEGREISLEEIEPARS